MATAPAWDDYRRAQLRHAQLGTDAATARLAGMKIRARLNPPTAAAGSFPYPHRTCAEWKPIEAHEGKGMNTKPRYR